MSTKSSATATTYARTLATNDEWGLQHRYVQIEGMAELSTPSIEELPTPLTAPKAA